MSISTPFHCFYVDPSRVASSRACLVITVSNRGDFYAKIYREFSSWGSRQWCGSRMIAGLQMDVFWFEFYWERAGETGRERSERERGHMTCPDTWLKRRAERERVLLYPWPGRTTWLRASLPPLQRPFLSTFAEARSSRPILETPYVLDFPSYKTNNRSNTNYQLSGSALWNLWH